MGKLLTSEAIVLKAYDIGDADRFCILLTEARGRLAVVAKGVRRSSSKWSASMQSFQHVLVDLAEHSSGVSKSQGGAAYYLRSAKCLTSFSEIQRHLDRFSLASQGTELLLQTLHDTDRSTDIFTLTLDFYRCCHEGKLSHLLPAFQLSLLKHLGLLPSFEEQWKTESEFREPSPALRAFLLSATSLHERAQCELSADDGVKLMEIGSLLLRDQLSHPLKSLVVSRNMAC